MSNLHGLQLKHFVVKPIATRPTREALAHARASCAALLAYAAAIEGDFTLACDLQEWVKMANNENAQLAIKMQQEVSDE